MEIDPKLIKKETSCVTTNTLIKYAEFRGLDIQEFLEGIPYPVEYLTNKQNWIIHHYTKKMYRRLNEMLNDEFGTYKAGLYSYQLRTLGVIEVLGRLFAAPHMVYKHCYKFSWKFNRVYEMFSEGVTLDHAIIRVRYFPEFEPTKEGCRYTEGILTVVPTAWMLPKANIKELQCQAEGADSCVYDISFCQKRGLLKNLWFQTFGRASFIKDALNELEANYQAIEAQRDALLENKINLERKVAERTAELKTRTIEAEKQKEIAENALKELKHAQSQLIEAEKYAAVYHLVAGVNHEMNTHLQTLLTNLQSIEFMDALLIKKFYTSSKKLVSLVKQLENNTNPKDFQGILTQIKSAALEVEKVLNYTKEELNGKDPITDILESITTALDAARIMQRTVAGLKLLVEPERYEMKPHNIEDIINSTLKLLDKQMYDRLRNLKIIKDYQNNLPKVYCDYHRLIQAMTIQILNSLDAMEIKEYQPNETPTLYFKVNVVQGKMEIITGDNGCGIPSSEISKIFNAFYSKKGRNQKGTGIGLTQVSGILRKHNATYEVKSEVNKYTEIKWCIPLLPK